jgi:hypothetical protein
MMNLPNLKFLNTTKVVFRYIPEVLLVLPEKCGKIQALPFCSVKTWLVTGE